MFAISLGDDGAELRPLEPCHAEEYFAAIERGRDHIGRFIPLADLAKDVAGARAFLQVYADKVARDAGRMYGIWQDGTLVGGVLFRTLDVAMGTAEAGCWLEPSASGRGLVTRAARIIIDWAVEERGIHRVEWLVAAGNTASVNVARRLGMTHEGTLRGNYVHRGVRHDTEVWSVLAPEWRAAREK